MDNMSKDPKEALAMILSDLRPEELEPRLELQVLVDPMGIVAVGLKTTNNNNNNNNKPRLV
ncbi:MAG: hypothetical protein ACLQVL_22405 [Terriglobia bacterium]